MKKILITSIALLLMGGLAHAQSVGQSRVYSSCGGASYTAGQNAPVTQDTTGAACVPGGSSSSPSFIKPAPLTVVTLDVKTVTTGGTPVTAIAATHRTAGGILCNPQGATINMGINEIGTAAGTTSSGDTTFIVPGQCYNVSPAAGAVSVITSDSAHPFSGYGLQ